jgi:hypothetical protein
VGHHFLDSNFLRELVDGFSTVDHHAGRIGVANIPVSDDADQMIIVEHGQLVHPMLRHHLARDSDTVESVDRQNPFSHPVRDANRLHAVFS